MPSPAESTGGLLAVAGDLVEDIVVWADEPLRTATDTAARVFRARGGSAANVAALAAPLVPTRFIGRVGADAAGAALADDLAAAGVVGCSAGAHGHGRAARRRRRRAHDVPRPRGLGRLAEVDSAWLDGVAWLHLPAYGLEREPMRPSCCGSRRSPGHAASACRSTPRRPGSSPGSASRWRSTCSARSRPTCCSRTRTRRRCSGSRAAARSRHPSRRPSW